MAGGGNTVQQLLVNFYINFFFLNKKFAKKKIFLEKFGRTRQRT